MVSVAGFWNILRRPVREILGLVALLCVSGGLVWAVYRTIQPQSYAVTAPDWIVPARQVYNIERASHDPAVLLRWTRGTVAFTFPNPGGNLMATITVARGPLWQAPVVMSTARMTLPVLVPPQARVFVLLLPSISDERSGLTLVTEPQRLEGRSLGMAFQGLTIAGMGQPPGKIALVVFLIVSVGSAVLRLLGVRYSVVLGSLLAAAVLGLAWHRWLGWHYGWSGVGFVVVAAQTLLGVAALRLVQRPARVGGAVWSLIANLAAFALLYNLFPAHRLDIFAEDQMVENLTAFWALVAFVLGTVVVLSAPRTQRGVYLVIPTIGLLAFLSEVSLGSRIFGWTMPVVYGVILDGVQDIIAIAIAIIGEHRDEPVAMVVLATIVIASAIILTLYSRYLWRHVALLRAPGILPFTAIFAGLVVAAVVVDVVDPRNRIASWLTEEIGELNAMVALCFVASTVLAATRGRERATAERSLGDPETLPVFR